MKKLQEDIEREMKILYKLPIQYHIVFALGKARFSPWIVLPYYSNGSLQTVMKKFMKDNIIFGSKVRLQIMLDCFHGLHHLHSHFFLHGDIKPQNILIDENMRAKITDFGSCEFMVEDEKIIPYDEFGKNG